MSALPVDAAEQRAPQEASTQEQTCAEKRKGWL